MSSERNLLLTDLSILFHQNYVRLTSIIKNAKILTSLIFLSIQIHLNKESQLVIIVFLEKSTSLSRKGDKLMA